VIHISDFVVIEIVWFGPREARQGDIAIKMALLKKFIQTIWLKISHDD
jgi:hypothetical protein